MQEEIIQSVLQGKDTLALMPTGGGKSLCYQVPAMLMDGLCLVVSPLIALMKDQVEGLRRKKITAYAVYAGMTRKEVMDVFKLVSNSNCKFLFVSPERLESSLFLEYLPGMGVQLIAVDEAHCISQWGYDFRPPYLRIAALRKELPKVPVLALTASATPVVQRDICERLRVDGSGIPAIIPSETSDNILPDVKGWNIFRQSFARPNLAFEVHQTDSVLAAIPRLLDKHPGCAIVYCRSRKRTKEISELLQAKGVAASFYHAGLSSEERNNRQEAWLKNQVRVIVCTNAFGMGIDKPDVRIVLHADIPDCLENYYQEAGRAGRDGQPAVAALLYNTASLPDPAQLVAERFPALADIRHIYQCLANYLQLGTGDGAGQYFSFTLHEFTTRFNLPLLVTLHVLKLLEQEGWLSFNEQVFLPSRVQVTASREQLQELEEEKPDLAICIQTLLRTYEGIYGQPAAISENQLSYLLRVPVETITAHLRKLHAAGIIDYEPRKDGPQVFFHRNRVPVTELTIDLAAVEARKKIFLSRINTMLQYISGLQNCRSVYIGNYFGDRQLTPCGVCDNCRAAKDSALSKPAFAQLQQRIELLLATEQHTAATLVQKMGTDEKLVWQVLNFLHAEGIVRPDLSGNLRWAKK